MAQPLNDGMDSSLSLVLFMGLELLSFDNLRSLFGVLPTRSLVHYDVALLNNLESALLPILSTAVCELGNTQVTQASQHYLYRSTRAPLVATTLQSREPVASAR